MRIISNIILCMLGITGFCNCSTQYNIDGNSTIAGIDGQKMYLRMTIGGNDETICLDSCEVVHGAFSFGGAIDSVAMVDLYMGSDPMIPVVLENGSLFIQMDNAAQSISGSPLNNRLNEFLAKQTRYENELWDINRRARYMVYEGKTLEQIVAAIDPLKNTIIEQMKSLEVDFVKKNYDNVLGPGYFMRMCNNIIGPAQVNAQILDILEGAPDNFLAHPFVENYLFAVGLTPAMLREKMRSKANKNDSTVTDSAAYQKATKKLSK